MDTFQKREPAGEAARSIAFLLALGLSLGAAVFCGASFLRSIAGVNDLLSRNLGDIAAGCRATSEVGAGIAAVEARFRAAQRDLTAGPGIMRASVAAIGYEVEKIRNESAENGIAREISQFEVILCRYEHLVQRLARDFRRINAEYLELVRLAKELRAQIEKAPAGLVRGRALLDLDRAMNLARTGVERLAPTMIAPGRNSAGDSFTARIKSAAASINRLPGKQAGKQASVTISRMQKAAARLAMALRNAVTHSDLLERTSTPFKNAVNRFNGSLPERLLSIRDRSAEHLEWARYIVFALFAALVSAMILAQVSLVMRNRNQARQQERLSRLLDRGRRERERLENELRRLEQENRRLRQSEDTWRDLFENASDMIQILSPEGRFLRTNHAWHRVLGYSREEIATMTVFDIIHPDCRGHCMRMFAETGGGETLINTSMLAKDGRRVEVEGHANLRIEDGRPVSTRCILRDVTAQRRMEAEAAKAMRLEGLAMMSGGLAHDLNNLLTAVTGNLSLIKAYGKDDRKISAKVAQTEKAIDRARQMLSRLLDFARIEEPQVVRTDVETVAREAAEIIAAGHGCALEWRIAPDLPEIDIDPGQIGQVLQNLVTNAAQAMGGGTVEIGIKATIITRESDLPLMPGDYLEISVRDFGPGIEPERMEHVFEPYFTTKEGGRGLGLAISYAMVRKHGGIIRAANHEDGGAVFSIYLPIPPSADGWR